MKRFTHCFVGVVLVAPLALAAPRANPDVPDYDFQWATIGAPGNPHFEFKVVPGDPVQRFGGVNYRYRVSTTEVTAGQWHEFVLTYAPFVGDDFNKPSFKGSSTFVGFGPGGVPNYTLTVNENFPVDIGWRYAARFVNWLHNGKQTTQDAFESGAYDTSTFGVGDDGFLTDQAARSPGAQFWIPSRDEWVKAAYYDPDRYGEGEGGYWRAPYGSDDPPVDGHPDEGGQTNAGEGPWTGINTVGSFPDANAPWGLLDVSGGQREWLEDYWFNPTQPGDRMIIGSRLGTGEFYYLIDRIEYISSAPPWSNLGGGGFRIASVVPSPGSATALAFAFTVAFARQRRRR